MSAKQRYTASLLSTPGMKFSIDIADPKARIQAYIDEYAQPVPHPGSEGQDEEEVRLNQQIDPLEQNHPTPRPKIPCLTDAVCT
jgi:hypothetical protein